MRTRILLIDDSSVHVGIGALARAMSDMLSDADFSRGSITLAPLMPPKSICDSIAVPMPHAREIRRNQQPFYRGLKKYKKYSP